MKKKKLAVVTGTRADYGILKPLLRAIKNSPDWSLHVLVTGMHLLNRFGHTINEIKKDDFAIEAIVPMYIGPENFDSYHSFGLARGIAGFTRVFKKNKYDLMVILGDRPEALAAVLAAAFFKIPIAHLHGGERTQDVSVDEAIRPAIVRFANLHLASTAKNAARLIRQGEEPWRVHNVGALGVDSVREEPPLSRPDFCRLFKLDPAQPFFVCLFHPVNLLPEKSGADMHELLEALQTVGLPAITIFPNSDAGNRSIIAEIKKYQKHPWLIGPFPSLPHALYANALRHAALLVGNSSSGIFETPAFKLPFVSVGERQKFRDRGNNVVDVPARKKAIVAGIQYALQDAAFRSAVRRGASPFGRGNAAAKIIRAIQRRINDPRLLIKRITY